MKDLPNKQLNQADIDKRNRLQALYDAAPYPEVLAETMSQSTPLLEHWINAAVAPHGLALFPTAHILVAGCGSGAEALTLAEQFPATKVVGVDFSERSIARAQILATDKNLANVSFEVADLTTIAWSEKYADFDFILCHGVADYVVDASALMRTLANCLAPNGVLYMTVNSPYHPAGRLRKAFATLGITPAQFTDSPQQRQLLQLMATLMEPNAGIEGLGNAPKAYLDVDIFPAIAHHDSIDGWCEQAKDAGLFFCGSMDAAVGLTSLSDEQIPLLYGLGKPELSAWMLHLRQRPGMQLLFSRNSLREPCFDDSDELWTWSPSLAACVGMLPELTSEPNQPKPMTLRYQGLPDFIIYSTAYDLEVLRRCDGKRTLNSILEDIPVQGNLEGLKACLFRAYHFGILAG